MLGGAAAVGGGLLLNHLLGDPAGKAVGNLINKGNTGRGPHGRPQPTNVEHHHHHYLPEEGNSKIKYLAIVLYPCLDEYTITNYTHNISETGYYSQWSGWQNGVCSRSCGSGTMNQQRSRHCSHGPNGCDGHADESRQSSCNTQECPRTFLCTFVSFH